MKAIFYKGEDITLTFISEVSLADYTTKIVKFFTPFSIIKEAVITVVNDNTFTAKMAKTDTAELEPGRLNIVVEFNDSTGNAAISKTIEAEIKDAYIDGGERETPDTDNDIVFLQSNPIYIKFNVDGTILEEVILAKNEALSNNVLLGYIDPTSTAPTPGKSGKYVSSKAGACSWLTSGSASVAIGDEILVIFSGGNYTYTKIANTQNYGLNIPAGFVACSPNWTIDASYNVTVPAGIIDIYYSNTYLRITAAQSFTLHSGSDNICLDLSDSTIKRVSDPVVGRHVRIGSYKAFDVNVNGNVKIITPTDINYSSCKKSDIINVVDSNYVISTVLRGSISYSSNIVTIAAGTYYFNTKYGTEYYVTLASPANYTIASGNVLVFNIITKTFVAKSKTTVSSTDFILLFYDAVEGFSKNGLWGNVLVKNAVDALSTRVSTLESIGVYSAIVNHVVRGGISISGSDVTLLAGDYFFYSQKGVEYIKTLASDSTFTLSNDWVLVFDLVSKAFIAQIKTSTTYNQVVLLLKDGGKGIVPSGAWATDVLNNKIVDLTTRVSTLETKTTWLPSFVSTAAKATFQRLLTWMDGEDTFLIAQVTDIHTSGTTKYLHVGYLAELQKVFGFNILWNGGDIGLDTGETLDAAYTLLYNTKSQMQSVCPFIMTKGNHDYGTQSIPTKTINDIFNVPQKRQFPNIVLLNAGYGYINDSVLKIRTYIINTSDLATVHYGMSQTQLQWLADTMTTLQENWGIVVLSHLCVDPIGRWKSYPNDASGAYFDTFRSIMAAFVAKTSGNNSTSGVTWNFTSVPSSAKLVCSIAGDSHFNNSTVTNGVNYIVRQGYGGISDSEMSVGATKDAFDYNTQCLFDILAIKKNGVAKVFRIGAGGDTRDLQFNY